MNTVPADEFRIRVSTPEDEAAVSGLLRASYPILMRPYYEQSALCATLPLMTRANPQLLASGTFYVAETMTGKIVGCGGWTREPPGGGDIEAGWAHLRHFATHAEWTGRGVGRLLYGRCEMQARTAGVKGFRCFSSLNAVDFYLALGFDRVGQTEIRMQQDRTLPSVMMARSFARPPAPG